MFLLAAATLAAAPPHPPVRPLVQARATVRILSGAKLHLIDGRGENGQSARKTVVRLEGSDRPAQLIEFE
jgi:hypothetical protein